MGRLSLWPLGAAWLLSLSASARAQAPGETTFGVVDVSPAPAPAALLAEVEKEIGRLRPGAHPVADPAMHRLLATGEGPIEAIGRLRGDTRRLRDQGDCARAVSTALEAEALTLANVPFDEEREILKEILPILVTCADESKQLPVRDAAARRLRALVDTPPGDITSELWNSVVAPATPGPPTIELFIDSEPANASVSISFHAAGGTPRTLKVPAGEVDIEIQKEGYRKAHRRLTVGPGPARTVFRLTERARDRQEQALLALQLIRKDGIVGRPATLSRLAQAARADSLVLVNAENQRVKILFFDADRGALGSDTIDSSYDPQTFRIAALATRPGILSPISERGEARRPGEGPPVAKAELGPAAGLPEADARTASGSPTVAQSPGRRSNKPPWWSWVIAAGVALAVVAAVYADQPEKKQNLDVRVRW